MKFSQLELKKKNKNKKGERKLITSRDVWETTGGTTNQNVICDNPDQLALIDIL